MKPSAAARVGRALDVLIRGIVAAIADVVAHARAEDRRLLRHEGHAGAQRQRIGLGDRHSIHQDVASLRIVEPQQQLQDRALAGPGRPDQGHPLAGATRRKPLSDCGPLLSRVG